MDVDLTALGLPPLAARVLGCVADEGWTTSVALAARLDAARSQVSAALELLTERGLVQRTRGRRPAPVRLAEHLDETVAATLAEQDARRRAQARAAEVAAAHLRRAGELVRSRPTPMTYLDPNGPAHDMHLLRPRTSYDEVCRWDGPSMLYGPPLLRSTRITRRVLVLGNAPEDRVAWLRREGLPMRSTQAQLPMLVVVDRCRARVELSAEGRASRTGWTTDEAQVAAAIQLFDLWWEAAGG